MGFLIAALMLILILCLRISLRVITSDEIYISVRIGFIKIRLLPKKEKPIKLRDFEITRFRKGHSKSPVKKVKKIQKTSVKDEDNEAAENAEILSDKLPVIYRLIKTIQVLFDRLGHHLQIEVKDFVLKIASGDVASTAVLYGAAVGVIQNLYAQLVSTGSFHTGRNTRFIVEPDFTAEKSTIYIDVAISCRLWQFIAVAGRTLIAYVRYDVAADSDGAVENV